MQQDGVRGDQVTQVRGYADQMLRVKNNPYDPSNRRVTILVENNDKAPLPPLAHAHVVDGISSPAASAPAAKTAASRQPAASAKRSAARPAKERH